MDYSQTFAISAAGMAVERTRVDIAALNLANANTVQAAGEVHYQPLRVVARTVPTAALASTDFQNQVDVGLSLPQAGIEPTDAPPRRVYEPGHPLANAKGFVSYAGVDSASEMVNLMSALRSYEANVAVMNAARTLALRALDIGGASS